MNESAKRKCQRLLKNCAKVTQVSDITSGQVFVAVGTCLVWCYNRHFRYFLSIEVFIIPLHLQMYKEFAVYEQFDGPLAVRNKSYVCLKCQVKHTSGVSWLTLLL